MYLQVRSGGGGGGGCGGGCGGGGERGETNTFTLNNIKFI